jgi:hypothetical protein
MSDMLVGVGVFIATTQSATRSGLNLAVFSLSRLRLEAAAHAGDPLVRLVLSLRHDANFTLATILLWNDDERRIATGSDILGRLLRRIARGDPRNLTPV